MLARGAFSGVYLEPLALIEDVSTGSRDLFVKKLTGAAEFR